MRPLQNNEPIAWSLTLPRTARYRELFCLGRDSVAAVSLETGRPSASGTAQTLFRGTYVGLSSSAGVPWDLNPDGKRFLLMKEPRSAASAER